ncbi:hypothetical protein BofuT4_uP034450.1 [Botrytis cinerea T4]|uniref:Uncharacterized protein n=1 Tax=Botryotinia fuckeliana (strain T4) TaxID=999810 RepID=G2Y875_BOTF4|nr:hypothetical protein BofuT4_uP034450.1 [Botrytis cinerea T4]
MSLGTLGATLTLIGKNQPNSELPNNFPLVGINAVPSLSLQLPCQNNHG